MNATYELAARNGLSHLDIKPDNLVFDANFNLKLIDFGHTTSFREPINITTGTDQYMAPEVRRTLTGSRNSYYVPEKADIFDLGVCLFILMF